MPFADYDDFDSCVRANQDVDDPEAYCAEIKRQVKGEDSLSDDEQKALEDSDCPEGQYMVNGECREIEEVDAPPSTLKNSANVFLQDGTGDETIERIEQDDGTVRYSNLTLLSPGVWTDAKSTDTIWYSPTGIENLEWEDTTFNLYHDEDNPDNAVGNIDAESSYVDDKGNLVADIVLDMDSTASEHADDVLQKQLETGGAKGGLKGPSVEIKTSPDDVEINQARQMKELVGGRLTGAGLVMQPASKSASFSRQVAEKGVALSSGEGSMWLHEGERYMADPETVREVLESNGIDTGEMTDDEVMAVGEDLMSEYEEESEEEEAEMQEGEEGEEEPEEEAPEDEPPEEEESEEMDMETKVEALEERLTNVEDMIESAMAAEDVEETLSEEIEEAKSDLADAETVQELSEANEELEKRLSDLEDKPETPRSLSEGATGDSDDEIEGTVQFAGSHDPVRNSYSR